MRQWVYVTVSDENRIAVFQMDDGELTEAGSVPAGDGPTPLAAHPGGRFLYTAARKTPSLHWFHRDPDTGAIRPAGNVPLEADPCFIATDGGGGYLFSAYYRAGMVTTHGIEGDGSLTDSPVDRVETAVKAHCIQSDATGRYALVPHTGPNRVYQFLFDAETGKLRPNDIPFWEAAAGEEPRHFCFHPALDVVYISNEKGSSVTACRFDPSSGTLSSFQSLSTLPEGWDGQNTCAQIHITSSGRHLYVSNRGHDSIAGYALDAADGRMTPFGQRPTEAVPRAFNVDPSGRFLIAAGRDTGRLAVYRIGADSGLLEPLDVVSVGARPMWVLIL